MPTAPAELGCERCRSTPTRFEDLSIVPVRILWNSSHSSFELWQCKSCGQRYLNQFHEILDWSGGEDDVWTRWMPLASNEPAEVEAMCREDHAPPEGLWNRLAQVMRRRERLVMDPQGRLYWSERPWDAGDFMPPG